MRTWHMWWTFPIFVIPSIELIFASGRMNWMSRRTYIQTSIQLYLHLAQNILIPKWTIWSYMTHVISHSTVWSLCIRYSVRNQRTSNTFSLLENNNKSSGKRQKKQTPTLNDFKKKLINLGTITNNEVTLNTWWSLSCDLISAMECFVS